MTPEDLRDARDLAALERRRIRAARREFKPDLQLVPRGLSYASALAAIGTGVGLLLAGCGLSYWALLPLLFVAIVGFIGGSTSVRPSFTAKMPRDPPALATGVDPLLARALLVGPSLEASYVAALDERAIVRVSRVRSDYDAIVQVTGTCWLVALGVVVVTAWPGC